MRRWLSAVRAALEPNPNGIGCGYELLTRPNDD